MSSEFRRPDGPLTHDLKIWPEFFDQIDFGHKTHEIRKADRDFKANDYLRLHEWEPINQAYTGRMRMVRVTYITRGGNFGLPDDLCVMSICKVSDVIWDDRMTDEAAEIDSGENLTDIFEDRQP